MLLQLEGAGIFGLVQGGVFALAALGIVLVYRVTGVLNFAHGAMGMFSTFVAWHVLIVWHPLAKTGDQAAGDWPSVILAVVSALLFSLALGFVLENAVFRWLRGRPQLVKAVITIGVLLVLQAGAALLFGTTQYHQAIRFPGARNTFVSFGPFIRLSLEYIIAVAAALVLAASLAAFLRFSRFGIAMRAVSDDPVAASLWGVPVNRVGSISWMLGSFVAAIAGILITPFINFDTVSLTVLIVDALAAALIGGLVSLPLTLLGGFLLGLLEAFPKIWIQSPGFPKVIAIVVILAVLLMRSERGLLRSSNDE
ncbi:MAG: branched-chain amino acid transport system permease protein [Chloroflexota bacterium]|jgi:branched-subunit amino acid ABC-type transport system permease component|nr:branched-chain amino acid transport system permease protein [Chloroflexota bacterium]